MNNKLELLKTLIRKGMGGMVPQHLAEMLTEWIANALCDKVEVVENSKQNI